jgi:D-threo-aldose 1-dehydrogenase
MLAGERACKLGYGTGGLLRIDSARERENVLAAALASGITHFDTAPIYGFGESERALGRFLARRRSQVTLTTKFGLQPSRLAVRLAPLQRIARRAVRAVPALRRAAVQGSGALYSAPDFNARAVRESLESSLRALRTDYVDFFLAHQASADALPTEETVDLLEGLQRSGKILAYGVATNFDWLLPVLTLRPGLSRVVQFDSELATGHVAALRNNAGRLLITYGFIARTVAACRERLRTVSGSAGDLQRADDDSLGGLLLRAAVLANPNGITLMQSRSAARIERNAKAATTMTNDEQVHRLTALFEPLH